MSGTNSTPDPKYTTKEAAEYLGLSDKTLETWRCTRKNGPAYLKLGRRVLYRQRDLDAWMDRQTVGAVAAG